MRFDISDNELKIIEGLITQKLVLGVNAEPVIKTLRQLRDTVAHIYGPTVTAILFYHLGRVEAERVFNVAKDLNLDIDLEKLLWINGSIKDIKIMRKGKLFKINIINNIDNSTDKELIIDGEGSGAGCYYIRGYLERLIELLYNTDVAWIKEVMCKFRGGKCCQYHILIR